MYLKALEIQGFKSFPDKVRLSFERDFTAIVGPNGSGKSNISDAICWVMGEQRSKTLRGTKMEDVIFGGSGQRSGSSFAQVSLIIDNSAHILQSDSDEVMITRRFYKSGESEYFINKTPVRLKDVNELLMDTGLGRDGYSIIGQGRVDEILSAKSTDRREVFEEAAGISRFRYRKEETQRKIEKTEESLLRVGDKISELELQVVPLKKQAETAKKFLLLRDELRGLEISIWMENLDRLKDKIQLINNDYIQTGNALEAEKQALDRLYADSDNFGNEMRSLDLRAEEIRAEVSSAEAVLNQLESEIAVSWADIKNNTERIERLNQEISQQLSRDTELRDKIEQRRTRGDNIKAELETLAEEREKLFAVSGEAETEAGEARSRLDSLLQAAQAEESMALALEAQGNTLTDAGRDFDSRKEAAEAEKQRLSGRYNEEKAALDRAEAQLLKLQGDVASAENTDRGFGMRVEARRKKLEEVSEKQRGLRMEESAMRSRIALLAEMEKEYEGFSKAVKVVMHESSRGVLKNIHGTIADIIKTDDKYTVAIETALGAALQNIIVGTEEDGKSAINLLKRTDNGRATFMPISVIRPNDLYEKGVTEEEGVEGIASCLVKCEDKYKNIISNLLGRCVITEDIDSAIRLSRKYSAKFRIVTLDGQIINAGGSMTGGSTARNVGILSRANELIRLQSELKEISARLTEVSKALTDADKELTAAVYQREAATSELRRLQDDYIKLKAEIGQREVLCRSLSESLEAAEKTRRETETGLEDNKRAILASIAAAKEHRLKAADIRREAEGLISGKAELEERLAKLSAAIGSLDSREASLKAEYEELTRGIEELGRLLADFGGEQESKRLHIEEIKADIQALEAAVRLKTEKAESQRLANEEMKERLAAVINDRLACESKKTRAEKEAQDKNKRIIDLERQHADINQKKLAAESEEKLYLDKLWETYELSRTAAQRLRLELESLPKATKRIGELRREIASLGSPNIGAIEEFERVNERYTFLTSQRDDIEKAKKELTALVDDITAEMEKIFAAEFKDIAENFTETFTELFGGGYGQLILEDENDILNCGIEIKVQPPGKTPKSLTLLSGGERAFVAIALYFAILKVRPTPFCVLDEIESALDEANVSRFADYLRKMSAGTQFIVITHRRGTMEEADELYGVTMQKGISKVISVENPHEKPAPQ